MADYVETSSQGWLSRLGGAIKGVLFGFVLVAGGVVLLFWGEGRAVKRAKTLDEGAGKVVAIEASRVDPAHDGALVHLSGRATTSETLRDPLFGVEAAEVLRLSREVEMFQWVEREQSEEKKKLGGGTETTTTYTYEQKWTSSPVDSSSFKVPQGHANPAFPFRSETWAAERVTLGPFRLGDELRHQMDREEKLAVDAEALAGMQPEVADGLTVSGGGFYRGTDPASPTIGDLRVSFGVVPPAEVTVVARQDGESLIAYRTDVGGDIALLAYGTKGPEQMFQAAQSANTTLLWILRGVGFFVVFLGFSMILRPLSVLADVVPFIGNLVGAGTGFVAFLLAAIVSLVTIAIGWIVYRPLLGIGLLVVVVALVIWLMKRSKSRAAAGPQPVAASAGGPPPPPPPPPS